MADDIDIISSALVLQRLVYERVRIVGLGSGTFCLAAIRALLLEVELTLDVTRLRRFVVG